MSTDNEDSDDLFLTEQEINSALWKRVTEYYERRLAAMRSKNDGALTVDQTSTLRGKISEIKVLLAAGTNRD